MVLFDVNVLIHAINQQSPDHDSCRAWLGNTISSAAEFGAADIVLSGFLRIVTNPKFVAAPVGITEAIAIVDEIRGRPNCTVVSPGPRHWDIFIDLCRRINARGNLVPDAYLAALAIESGCDWITTDRDYARFPGLRWRHPLDA